MSGQASSGETGDASVFAKYFGEIAKIDWHINRELLIFPAICLFLLVFALWRIWSRYDRKRETLFMPVLWTVLAVFIPLLGPLFALAFARIPPKHGEDIGPTRGINSADRRNN